MHIRPATTQDHAALVANNQAMAWETESRHLDDAVLSAGVRALLDDPRKGFYLVAEAEGQIVGSLMVTSEWSDWRNGEMWWFQSVYVLPAWRKHGVFKAMYAEVMRLARAGGARELRLYVERDNHVAQRTYAAMGMAHSHYDMWEVTV